MHVSLMAAAVASLANQARDWADWAAPHVQWDALYLAFEATGYLITGEVPQRMGSVPWCKLVFFSWRKLEVEY